jgi:hypothetical protein
MFFKQAIFFAFSFKNGMHPFMDSVLKEALKVSKEKLYLHIEEGSA